MPRIFRNPKSNVTNTSGTSMPVTTIWPASSGQRIHLRRMRAQDLLAQFPIHLHLQEMWTSTSPDCRYHHANLTTTERYMQNINDDMKANLELLSFGQSTSIVWSVCRSIATDSQKTCQQQVGGTLPVRYKMQTGYEPSSTGLCN